MAESQDETVLAELIDAFRGGDKSAVDRLTEFVEKTHPKNEGKARAVLGSMLRYRGQLEKAAVAFEAAAQFDSEPRAALFCDSAQIRLKQGQNGSGYSEKKGSYCYGPTLTEDDEAEEAWKRDRLILALQNCEQGLAVVDAEDEETQTALQDVATAALNLLGDADRMVSFFRQMLKSNPESIRFQFRLGRALAMDSTCHAEAKELLLAVIASKPNHAAAWKELSKLCDGVTTEDERVDAERRSSFFQFVPDFITDHANLLDYSPEWGALVARIDTEADVVLGELRANQSDASSALLVAIGAHHFHGPIDDGVFAELQTRGASELVRNLCHELITTQEMSLCTIKYALRVLCSANDERAYGLVERLLPQDTQMFTMDVANSAAMLDERIVPVLIHHLEQSGIGQGDEDDDSDSDDFFRTIGSDSNVSNSKYALSSFPASVEALTFLRKMADAGDQVAVCALFRATQENRAALEQMLENLSELAHTDFLTLAVAGTDLEQRTAEKIAQLKEALVAADEQRRLEEERGVENWMPTPAQVESWKESHVADLAHERAQRLPGDFFDQLITHVTRLELCDNRLVEIPLEICVLAETLTEVNLQANRLRGILSLPGALPNLVKLGFHGNEIAGFDANFFSGLPKLESLTVSHNQLKSWPNNLNACPNLKDVNVGYNQLTELPDEFACLPQLERLHCDGNQLTSLPPSLFALTSLQSLYAGSNSISSLPARICWVKPSNINLSGNQLKSLPFCLSRLRHCYANGNPFITEESEVVHGEMTLQEETLRQMRPDERSAEPTGYCDVCEGPFFNFWISATLFNPNVKPSPYDEEKPIFFVKMCRAHEKIFDQ